MTRLRSREHVGFYALDRWFVLVLWRRQDFHMERRLAVRRGERWARRGGSEREHRLRRRCSGANYGLDAKLWLRYLFRGLSGGRCRASFGGRRLVPFGLARRLPDIGHVQFRKETWLLCSCAHEVLLDIGLCGDPTVSLNDLLIQRRGGPSWDASHNFWHPIHAQ